MSYERKVVFVNIDGIFGLPEPHDQFSLRVGLYPKGEESSGKCNSTWSLIYRSEIDELVSINLYLNTTLYAKLLLPLKWFEVNSNVRETFPMKINDSNAIKNQIKIMVAVVIHRSENGQGPFTANNGKLLVIPQWKVAVTETHNKNPTSNDEKAKNLTNPEQSIVSDKISVANKEESTIQSNVDTTESSKPQIPVTQPLSENSAQQIPPNLQIPNQTANSPLVYPVLQPQYVFVPTTNGQFIPMLLLPATKDSPALLTQVYTQPPPQSHPLVQPPPQVHVH